jgi:hypothetical protein
MARVYVSSTFSDLQECRKKIELLLRRMGHIDVAMEYYVAEDQRPLTKCLADVAACDLYIGIFAWRYGYVPEAGHEKLSITELEYCQALKSGKACLIFLLSEDAAWPRKLMDADMSQIERLRRQLSAKHVVGIFNSQADISEVVAPALHQWTEEQETVQYVCTKVGQKQLEALHAFCEGILGAVANIQLVREWHDKNPNVLYWVNAQMSQPYQQQSSIVGVFSVFPITDEAAQLFSQNKLRGSALTANYVVAPGEDPAAIYIGAVAARGPRAKQQTLIALMGYVTALTAKKASIVYTCPVTNDGLRVAKQYGFHCVLQDAPADERQAVFVRDFVSS